MGRIISNAVASVLARGCSPILCCDRNEASKSGEARKVPHMRASDLLTPRPDGLYCPPADVWIDPVRPVARALISHGHSDHARSGHGAVLATRETLGIMAVRYGENFADATEQARFGEAVVINGVRFTFAPAGHVLGSAQIA